jgi:ribonucleoside-triphosphate reductase
VASLREHNVSNLTFDLTPPEDLLNENVIIGGEFYDFTYKSCQKEMDMLNKAFYKLMLKGDANSRPFAYPIPTYNIHSRFDWDNPNNQLLWEMAGKYGYPYFANFLNSDMKPSDIRSMCCRLSIDLTQLSRRNGGLFGAGDSTGSIGVVTINLPRIAYLNSGNKKRFYKDLENTLELAKDSLEIKRKWLQENIVNKKAIPAYCTYVGTLDNHFSTIGVVGMNEMCENFFGEGIDIITPQGKQFAIEISNFIRNKLIQYQEETGNLYNYEATPAESTCYRLAKKDKEDRKSVV